MSLQRQLRRLFSSLENDERDLEIARLKKELTAWEYHSGAKLMNCLITPRDDEYGSGLFRGNQKTISCCLVGYAIVPLEKYEAQEKRIKALEEALREVIKIEDSNGMAIIGWNDAMDVARALLEEK